MDNARLFREARESEREARALYQAALAIGGELDLAARLERVLDAALELLGVEQADVALLNSTGTRIEVVAARGEHAKQFLYAIPAGEGLRRRRDLRQSANLRL